MNSLRDTMSRGCKANRATRISQMQKECGELSEELERQYLHLIHKSIVPNVSEEEAKALTRLAGQYVTNKKHLGEILGEFGEVVEENEVCR